MAGTSTLGGFEHQVLLAVASFGAAAEGMAIYDHLVETTGREVAVPAVYVSLKRLEQKGFVSSERVAGTRNRKAFRLEPPGRAALRESRDALERLWNRAHLEEPS